ncbi:hypothetical protein CHUAL_002576 [Chamberlinius hualienensis]
MRLRNNSNMSGVPLRVAMVRQGIGHRICYLSPHEEKENFAVKKGLLWIQRDKLFSRWNERYFILTKDYLACFKKSSKIASSDMGGFIFKLSLADVDGIEWIEKKDYGMVAIMCPMEGRFFLRAKSGSDEWLQVLKEAISQSKVRREALRSSVPVSGSQIDSISSHNYETKTYLNNKIPLHYSYSEGGADFYRLGRNCPGADFIRGSTGLLKIPEDYVSSASSSVADSSRFSLITDIDLRSGSEDTSTPSPSSSSCSTSSRHYFSPPQIIYPPGIPVGHRRTHSHGRPPPRLPPEAMIVYTNPKMSPRVDRSHSDAYHLEAQARRRLQSDRELTTSAVTSSQLNNNAVLPPQIRRRISNKSSKSISNS